MDDREALAEDKGYSIQEAYQKIGGIRLFHWFASLMMIMGYLSGQYIGQMIGYLELVPKYICSDSPNFSSPYKCSP